MLEKLKQQVVRYALQADRSGLCKQGAGNFSARDTETGYICITPTGIDREELNPDDIVVIDLDANVIEAATDLRPTSEALMHIAVYKAHEQAMAIAHTHSRYATAFAVLKKPIPAIVYEIMTLGCKGGYIPVAAYGRPGTPGLAERVAQSLSLADVALMESHGVITMGKSLKEALLKASYTEELAEIYYRSLVINKGEEPPVIALAELQKWEYPQEIKQLAK